MIKRNRSYYEEDDGFGIAFSDVLIFILITFVIVFAIVPKETNKNKSDQAAGKNIGSICVDLSWPDDRNVDLDLWGRAPDGVSVGFSNPHSQYLDLLRDITGYYNNPSHRNYEVMCGRTLLPGQWSFNVSYYMSHDQNFSSVPATVTITLKKPNYEAQNLTANFTMDHIGQEKTIFNFTLDEQGRLVETTINSRPTSVVRGAKY